MKKPLSYTLIIVATLIIGMAIGFLINGRLTQKRMKRMKDTFTEQGFHRDFERAIQATPEQMLELQPIVDGFAKKQRDQMHSFRTDRRLLFEEFREEIKPYLTDEQLDRLEKMHKKNSERNRHKKRRMPNERPPR